MRMKDEEWDQVIAVDLTAAFRLSRGVLRGMMKKRWGRIVSDHLGGRHHGQSRPGQLCRRQGGPGRHDRNRWPRKWPAANITVNCVAPGFIATAMTDALTDAQKEAINTRIPAGRMGTAGEIAAATLYLASEEAGYVTGQTVHVNGGMAMI